MKSQIYFNNLYIGPGKPTTVKVFVGNNKPAAIFNSIDLAKIVDDIDCSVKVCAIQSNKVVVACYLNGSTNTFELEHFTYLVEALPRMKKLDVEVNYTNITELTEDPTKRVEAARILCAEKDKEAVNAALFNTYCITRKNSRVPNEYPERRNMKYVPLKMTSNIALTP